MKMEVPVSSGISSHMPTTRSYIPEDGNIQNYHDKNLKSYIDVDVE
jgi:hypothetical protein